MMGMEFGFLVWIMFILVFFLILHFVIRSAMNQSEMNRTLKEIRDLLKSQNRDGA